MRRLTLTERLLDELKLGAPGGTVQYDLEGAMSSNPQTALKLFKYHRAMSGVKKSSADWVKNFRGLVFSRGSSDVLNPRHRLIAGPMGNLPT